MGADVGFGALEGGVFSYDDFGNSVKESGTAAHGAGGEGGVEGALAIDAGGLASRIFQAVHLGVMNNAAVLDSLVVAAPDDFTLVNEDGTDGDTAGGESFAGFINGGEEEGILGHDRSLSKNLGCVSAFRFGRSSLAK